MARPARSPLDGADRLLVDGTNLLHAARRGPGAAPQPALVGRLRAAIPAEVEIELVFDGAPERGMRGVRIASGLTVRHGGRFPADAVILGRLEEERGRGSPPDAILVVTDDRELRQAVQARGARTAGSGWLLGRLDRRTLASPTSGNPRPARPLHPPGAVEGDDEDDRRRWRPGRGATTKRGNPKRGH